MTGRFVNITRGTASSAQNALVDAIIEFKTHSQVPSLSAFKFLKTERAIDSILEFADPIRPYNMTREEFKTLCEDLQAQVQFMLDTTSILASDIYNGGAFAFHKVLKVYESPRDAHTLEMPPDHVNGRYVWFLDYAYFFQELFDNIEAEAQFDDKGGLNPDTVADILEQNAILTLIDTGETINFEQFKKIPRFRSILSPEELEAKYVMLAEEGESYEIDKEAIHDRWARLSLNFVHAQASEELKHINPDVRETEAIHLYAYKQLYLRAKKEDTLHQSQTQIAIARAFVMNRRFYHNQLFSEDAFPFDKLLKYARRIASGPGNLAELSKSEHQHARDRIAMGEYIVAVLIENQNLLSNYFRSLPYSKNNEDKNK